MNRLVLYTVATLTLTRRECLRFLRTWTQTFIPPVITMTLYFLIFGKLIGSQISEVDSFHYMDFIAPGLIMMSTISSSYVNTSSSLYIARFQNSIQEVLVSPMPNWSILLGYMSGGILRGLITALLIAGVTTLFTDITFAHIGVTLATAILCATFFSLAGFTNGLFARKFDDISLVPTFILTPLSYFGGVFYSLEMLPSTWQKLSLINPILYIVNAFRYGILGISDVPISHAISVLFIFVITLFSINLLLLKKGFGVRS